MRVDARRFSAQCEGGVWCQESDRRWSRQRRFAYREPGRWRIEEDGVLRLVSDGTRSASRGSDGWLWVPPDRDHHSSGLRMMLFPSTAPLWGGNGDDYQPGELLDAEADTGLVSVRFDPFPGESTEPLEADVDSASGVVRSWSVSGARQRFTELVLDVELPDTDFEVPAEARPDPPFA
ncbi:hypothetical protein [Streptomyces sp. NPDC046821]|uniref:hypothetical protein n=1 Tax=Streptomyces sp. NPDC046821 TaxID=3154702 RepID=UPI0033EB5A97